MELGQKESLQFSTVMPALRPVRVPIATFAFALLLALWLVVQLPAFLCMGLNSDPAMYDVLARRVLKGSVLYQDLLETNLPGIVWLHMGVRSALGWSTEALRAVDVAVVALIVGLLMQWQPRSMSARGRLGVAAVLFAFYFSTTEWCHCQRDTWMLLPCLIALGLRCRQTDRMLRAEPASRLLPWAVIEGVVWAIAFWIKPFVAIPCLVSWLIAARHATAAPGALRRLSADFAGLLAGGMTIGALGIGSLLATGAWGAFLDIMLVWNREYFDSNMSGESPALATVAFAYRFFPWILVHLAAVPLAIHSLCSARGSGAHSSLRAGFYLAWLIQSFFLQHLFDYVHVPALFLGIAILAAEAHARIKSLGGWLIVAFLVVCIAWRGIPLTVERAALWSEGVAAGSTPDMKYRAASLRRSQWRDLALVADFLKTRGVVDGEVTCFTDSTTCLYKDLDIHPSTRYVILDIHLMIFPSRRAIILESLADSRQKFVVCDLSWKETSRLATALNSPSDSEPLAATLKERVVFRSGNVVVFQMIGSETAQWWEFFLL